MIDQRNVEIQKKSKAELYSALETFFLNAGFCVKEYSDVDRKRIYSLTKNEEQINITVLIKNISGCGWKDRKNIKRIQVLKMARPPKTTKSQCFLLLGMTSINGSDILVAWNPLKYIYHEKNRSAYVYDEALFEAYNKGFYQTVQNGEKILVCNNNHFSELLDQYYRYSYVEEI